MDLVDAWEEVDYVTDGLAPQFHELCPSIDACEFDLENGPAWLHVSQYALLGGKPQHSDIGPFEVELRATNEAGLTKTVKAHGQVLEITSAPAWAYNPINLPTVAVGTRFVALLYRLLGAGGGISNSQYEVIGAPAWLTLEREGGYLHGIPASSDIGEFAFTVRAFGPTGLFSDATARLTVIP